MLIFRYNDCKFMNNKMSVCRRLPLFKEDERRKHSKQHKLQDSKRKSQSSHSTSSRNMSEKRSHHHHHHLKSAIVPRKRKSNEKKHRSKLDPTEGGALGKTEAPPGKVESARISSSSSSSSSSSTKVGRPRYSSGHRYCMAGREGATHTSTIQRRHHNRESQRSRTMRKSRYSRVYERRGRHVSKRRGFTNLRTKSDCDPDSTMDKNLPRDPEGDFNHGNDTDEDDKYRIDQGNTGPRSGEDACWSLPEHLLDEQSKNLYSFTNDGCHSGYAPDPCSWSWRDHDEQLYADYYYNYNQCYSYYYAYNDCYFYQPRPEAQKPLYHPGHVVYDLIFEEKDSVVGNNGDIHMIYRKICQDVSHGNFSGIPGSLNFPYDVSGSHFFSPVLDNEVSNNGGNVGLVEESSRSELFPFQDPYAFPINKPDSTSNMAEGTLHPVCLPPLEDYSTFKAFLPDASEYSRRQNISDLAKPIQNQKQNPPESSPSAEDAEFERAFKRIMMEQFSLFTNFTPEFSEWCLDSCDWDYGKAAWNFIYDPRKVQKIPREAYNV